jgi:hypothetical protein
LTLPEVMALLAICLPVIFLAAAVTACDAGSAQAGELMAATSAVKAMAVAAVGRRRGASAERRGLGPPVSWP